MWSSCSRPAGTHDVPQERKFLSKLPISVDRTLIEAWASLKNFRPREDSDDSGRDGERNPDRGFHGERCKNDPYASTTDRDAKLFRKGKGKEARLVFMGHVLRENRHGLVVDARLGQATGTAECEVALDRVAAIPGGIGSRRARTRTTTPARS